MPTLDLPDTPRAAVWRLLRARLRDDAVLAACIKTWRIPDGTDTEVWASLEDDALSPALRLVPRMDPLEWYSAESMVGGLTVDIEAFISGSDAEDVMNLQGAIETALYPLINTNAFQQALVGFGAETGLVKFVRPLDHPSGADRSGGWKAMGAISIEVIRTLIP